jgi:hypothetical protein
MITNADLTLYHKIYDPEKRDDVWTGTQYPAVNWYGGQIVAVGDSGLSSADHYKVRIPTTNEVEAAAGDIAVKGLVEDKPTGATALTRKYSGQCFVVTHVQDNRRGSPGMQHWRLEGK